MYEKRMIELALKARENAYCPYSGFAVGAALLWQDGTIYTGCNIESSAYTATVCAERTAFFKAVSEGKREFVCIAVAGGRKDADLLPITTPCGVCRQVMAEICDPETFRIDRMNADGVIPDSLLKELLPLGFTGKALEK